MQNSGSCFCPFLIPSANVWMTAPTPTSCSGSKARMARGWRCQKGKSPKALFEVMMQLKFCGIFQRQLGSKIIRVLSLLLVSNLCHDYIGCWAAGGITGDPSKSSQTDDWSLEGIGKFFLIILVPPTISIWKLRIIKLSYRSYSLFPLPTPTYNMPSKVDTGAKKGISRSTIDLNEVLLEIIIGNLGSRVGVDLLYFHLDSFYKLMNIPVDSSLFWNYNLFIWVGPQKVVGF